MKEIHSNEDLETANFPVNIDEEKFCIDCCHFDGDHIGMDGMAMCQLTKTLTYCEDYGGNCMFFNVPRQRIIIKDETK